jgi:hypothetical protein
MTFPTGTVINRENLESSDRDPNLARIDLLTLVDAFNQVVDSANQEFGIAVLGTSGRLSSSQLPSNLNMAGIILLQPSAGVVNVRNVLRLYPLLTQDLDGAALGTDTPQGGDLVYLVDGDAGQPCLGLYDGSNWRVVRLMTQVGDVGAALSLTSSLTAEADE